MKLSRRWFLGLLATAPFAPKSAVPDEAALVVDPPLVGISDISDVVIFDRPRAVIYRNEMIAAFDDHMSRLRSGVVEEATVSFKNSVFVVQHERAA